MNLIEAYEVAIRALRFMGGDGGAKEGEAVDVLEAERKRLMDASLGIVPAKPAFKPRRIGDRAFRWTIYDSEGDVALSLAGITEITETAPGEYQATIHGMRRRMHKTEMGLFMGSMQEERRDQWA